MNFPKNGVGKHASKVFVFKILGHAQRSAKVRTPLQLFIQLTACLSAPISTCRKTVAALAKGPAL